MNELEYNARVYVKSKVHYFPMIKSRLGLERSALFRQTCFGNWLDLNYVQNDESLIHYMLQKQKFSDDDHYDLPLIYDVNGHILHFGRREFCLISGLKFGWTSLRKFRQGDIFFRDRVFPEKIGEDLKNIDLLSLIEDEALFTSLSDLDCIRVCLLLTLEVIFKGHDLGSVIDDVYLRMVEDLDSWNDFSWGECIWRELYGAIRNVNSKHKQAHLQALENNPDYLPTYSLSGFVFCFKIWILESSSVCGRWWSKVREGVPRACLWNNHFPFQNWETFGQLFPQGSKPHSELSPNTYEAFSQWFTKSSEYLNKYAPRAPPVVYVGLFGDYLAKLSAARALRERARGPFIKRIAKVVTLRDRVRALESLCDNMMILPKEIQSLKARVYKLETIIKVLTNKKKVLNQQRMESSVGKECDLGDKYWSDQDGELFFEHLHSEAKSDKNDNVNNLVAALDLLVDENVEVELHQREILDESTKAQRLEAEKLRIAEHKRLRLKKMKEEENSMNINSSHMKIAIERCAATNKKRYVNVLRPPLLDFPGPKIPSIDTLKNQHNILDEIMIQKCQPLKPWKEDLNRPFNCIEKIFCDYNVEMFLSIPGRQNFKFPWCSEIVVGRSFWNSLLGLDEERLGWLIDDHVDLWVWYMWHFREASADWSMVSCYFLTLLLQDSMPLFYATDEVYPKAWKDVEQVFIPINETKSHWSLAVFHIQSGIVTFYDSEKTFEPEIRPWYTNMRECLKSKLPVVLEQTGVFASKGIDSSSYRIKFTTAQNVPKQGGVFGDCGVFVCMFLYRLSHGIPLTLEDPIQSALAYREKLVKFYFEHKIEYPC